MGLLPLTAVAAEHDVIVVRPRSRSPFWRRAVGRTARTIGLLKKDPVTEWVKRARVPTVTTSSGNDPHVAGMMRSECPDLVCIATFPWILGANLLALSGRGVINMHPSLLPRHRGPNPYFWTYYHNDRTTGVTVHVVTERVDAGPILAQAGTELRRGEPIEEMYAKLSRLGGDLVRRVVANLDSLMNEARVQDDTLATCAPSVGTNVPMVDFTHWDVERVWHFMKGLFPRYTEPLVDSRGSRIRYKAVMGFERTSVHDRPGIAHATGYGWQLCCHDGFVRLANSKEAQVRLPSDD